MASFQSIVTPLLDMARYKATQSIHTGDRHLDIIVNTLVLAILSAGMAKLFYESIFSFWYWIQWRCSRKPLFINQRNLKPLAIQMNTSPYKCMTWVNSDFDLKLLMFVAHVYDHIPGIRRPCMDVWDVDKKVFKELQQSKQQYSQDQMTRLVHMEVLSLLGVHESVKYKIIPLYMKRGKFVGLAVDDWVQLAYNDQDLLTEFFDVLHEYYNKKKCSGSKAHEHTVDLQVMTINSQYNPYPTTEYVYANRTIEHWISRHRPVVVKHLEDFVNAQRGVSPFNGFGTYNLGIMLYGPPGTGKTSLIKSVCNYLKRSPLLVDLKKIHTITDLAYILNSNVKKYVFVLDEFDCIQDAITRDQRVLNTTVENLQEQYLQTMRMVGGNLKDNPALQKEVDDMKKEIDNARNGLTLQGLLTILDGTSEVRGRCIIAATNHIEKIDPALMREGRFDLKLEMSRSNVEETRELLTLMYQPNQSHQELINQAILPDEVYSAAQIIHQCHKHRDLEKVLQVLCEETLKETIPVNTMTEEPISVPCSTPDQGQRTVPVSRIGGRITKLKKLKNKPL